MKYNFDYYELLATLEDFIEEGAINGFDEVDEKVLKLVFKKAKEDHEKED